MKYLTRIVVVKMKGVREGGQFFSFFEMSRTLWLDIGTEEQRVVQKDFQVWLKWVDRYNHCHGSCLRETSELSQQDQYA